MVGQTAPPGYRIVYAQGTEPWQRGRAILSPPDLGGADGLTHQKERNDEPDNQNEKHKDRSFAPTDDRDSCGYSCQYPRQACAEAR